MIVWHARDKMRRWQEFENSAQYYFDDVDGLIIGQIHKFGNSTHVYTATVKPHNIDQVLGQYISGTYAMKAIERYWNIEDGTLIGE
jgi:hypothetical protein